MEKEQWVGLTASIFTSIALIPQLIKLLKTKDAKNFSLLWIVVLLAGVAIWVVYGIMKHDWIIISSNIVAVVINTLMVYYTHRFKQTDASAADH